jgi:hypothetical protein
MYLVSLFEEEAVVEASLGGRVTADEARVFGEELIEMLESFGGKPFNMLLDYSKATCLDSETLIALSDIKDQCLQAGAVKIVSVAQDEQDMVRHTSERFQQVLDGFEEFVLDAAMVQFPVPHRAAIQLAA